MDLFSTNLFAYRAAAAFGSIGHFISAPLSIQPAIGASGTVAGVWWHTSLGS